MIEIVGAGVYGPRTKYSQECSPDIANLENISINVDWQIPEYFGFTV